MRAAFRSLAVACCALAAGTAAAQARDGHGIAGFWSLTGAMVPRREPSPTEAELMAYFPEDAIVLADAGATEFPPGDYGGLAVHEALREAAKSYDPEQQTTVSLTCKPPGLIYSMQGPFPIEIFEGRDLIVIKLEYFDLVRVIFMNETRHPDDWPHSQTGHSFGRWEGDTLVVDTVGFAPGILAGNVPHSDRLHVVERFALDPATMALKRDYVATDPVNFTDQYAGTDTVMPADAPFAEDRCEELTYRNYSLEALEGRE